MKKQENSNLSIPAEMSSKMKEAQQNKEENKKENNVKVKVR